MNACEVELKLNSMVEMEPTTGERTMRHILQTSLQSGLTRTRKFV